MKSNEKKSLKAKQKITITNCTNTKKLHITKFKKITHALGLAGCARSIGWSQSVGLPSKVQSRYEHL